MNRAESVLPDRPLTACLTANIRILGRHLDVSESLDGRWRIRVWNAGRFLRVLELIHRCGLARVATVTHPLSSEFMSDVTSST